MTGTRRSTYPFSTRLAAELAWVLAVIPALVLAVVLACGSDLHAQPPSRPPTPPAPVETTLPSGFPPLVEPTADPVAAERIQRALQGGTSDAVPGGVLGDVIDIIRTQGSILDGSSLDPRMIAPERGTNSDGDFLATETTRAPGQASVQAAEALLRSARMLESLHMRSTELHDAHPGRLPIAELVRQMRIQATRLLATEFPQAID